MSWLDTLRQALGLPANGPALEEDRRRMRIRCELKVSLSFPNDSVIEARTANVNSKGITVVVHSPLKRAQPLEAQLHGTRGGGGILRLQAQPIWCRRQANSDEYESGLEFAELPNYTQPIVLAFLRQELAVPVLDDRQKRRFRRISTDWPVEYAVSTLEHRQAQVKDISPCGCLLQSRYPLLMWSDITLSLRPDPAGPPIRAHAVVRRCTKLPQEDWWEIACPLVSMSDSDQTRLIAAIEKHLESPRRRRPVRQHS